MNHTNLMNKVTRSTSWSLAKSKCMQLNSLGEKNNDMYLQRQSTSFSRSSNEMPQKSDWRFTKRFRAFSELVTCMGLLTYLFGSSLVKYIVKQEMRLVPGTNGYDIWVDTTAVPVFAKFYLFSVENPQDLVKGNKLRLRELGPYTFR